MADNTTPGLDAIPEDISVKSGTKAKPTIANESVLAQMQDLYKQKQAEKNYFLQDLADASAWWSGGAAGPTEGLAKRAAVRAMQTKELQDLQAGIAGQQNALQNRDTFSYLLSGIPTNRTATRPTSEINLPQAKAGVAELDQKTNGVFTGLVPDPRMQKVLAAAHLEDPSKGMAALLSYVAKEASTPDEVKKVQYALQFLPPEMREAAVIAGLLPKGIDIQQTTLPTGEARRMAGFDIAKGFVKPSAPAMAPSAPTTQAPVVAPTTPGAAPSTPAAAPSAPTTTPSASVTKAPIQATTQVAGRGGLNPQQTEALGGVLTPGSEQAGEVLKESALVPIRAREAGLKKDYASASDEGTAVNQAYFDSGKNRAIATQLKELTKIAEPTLGIFQKPGPAAGIMATIDSGELKLGVLGNITAPLDELASRLVPGTGKEVLEARQRVKGLLAGLELAVARENKGQGSWTELERNIIRGMSGTVKNSKEFLTRRAELLEAQTDFDEKLGQAARDWLRQNKGKTYYDFKRDSDDYERIVKEYRTTLHDKFAAEFAVAKQKPVTGVSKDTQNILNQYPSSKKEGTK